MEENLISSDDQKYVPKDNWKLILHDAVRSNLEEILVHISDELNENSDDPAIREAAAYQLKCALTSPDPQVKMKKREKWLSFSQPSRTYIKKNILKCLSLEMRTPSLIAQCVSHISCAELPLGEWKELPTFFDSNVTNVENGENLKQITLDTINCICDEDTQFGTDQLNDSIIRIIFHVLKYEKSFHLKIAALNLFINCVDRLRVVFENEPENQLMLDALCETSEAENAKIQAAALKSLEKVVLAYYKHVRKHLNTDLLKITINALKSEKSETRLQGTQFLHSICSEEEKIELSAVAPLDKSVFFADQSLKQLLPRLLDAATKEEEIGSLDESLGEIKHCLCFIVSSKSELTLNYVTRFVKENIASPRWSCRNAAMLSFDSVIRKCSAQDLKQLIELVLSKLTDLLQDCSLVVKYSAVGALEYLCGNFKELVTPLVDLVMLVGLLLKALEPQSDNAATVCEAIRAIAHLAHFEAKKISLAGFGHQQLDTYCLSSPFEKVVVKLVELVMQPGMQESDLGRSAQHTLCCMVRESPKDCSDVLYKLVDPLLKDLKQVLKSEVFGKTGESLLLILPILKCIVQKIPSELTLRCADELMDLVCHVLDTFGNNISIEAMKVVGEIAKSLGNDFSKFIALFKPCMMKGLASDKMSTIPDNLQIVYFHTAIHAMAEVYHSVGYHMLPYSDEIIPLLGSVCKSNFVCCQKNLKAVFSIFSIIGDIAAVMGVELKKYYDDVFQLLMELWQQMEKRGASKVVLSKLKESYRKTCLGLTNALNDESISSRDLLKLADNVQ